MATSTLNLSLVVIAAACATEAYSQSIREFSLETVERLGREIYEQDAVAWRASESLRAENKSRRVADSEMAKIRGWIVARTPDAYIVKFIAEGPQGPYPVFVTADYRDRDRALAAAPPQKGPLSEAELAHFRARQLAVGTVKRRCSDAYNTVVLPNTDGNGFLVYALAATRTRDVMVAGGHYRFTVSQDGTRIVQADELSRSCLTVSLGPSEKGVVPEYVVVTHHVSDKPLETHVFLSLLHKKDIAVATGPQTVWLVSKGRIRRLQ